MDFSEIIKQIRARNNESQEEMAERLNLSQGSITGWETGVRTPSFKTLIKIADTYNVSVDYLLGRELPVQPPEPDTVAAHTEEPLTPEMERRVQELAEAVYKKLIARK